jgi:hypothetical protein
VYWCTGVSRVALLAMSSSIFIYRKLKNDDLLDLAYFKPSCCQEAVGAVANHVKILVLEVLFIGLI